MVFALLFSWQLVHIQQDANFAAQSIAKAALKQVINEVRMR
jgi:hypothetical protein